MARSSPTPPSDPGSPPMAARTIPWQRSSSGSRRPTPRVRVVADHEHPLPIEPRGLTKVPPGGGVHHEVEDAEIPAGRPPSRRSAPRWMAMTKLCIRRTVRPWGSSSHLPNRAPGPIRRPGANAAPDLEGAPRSSRSATTGRQPRRRCIRARAPTRWPVAEVGGHHRGGRTSADRRGSSRCWEMLRNGVRGVAEALVTLALERAAVPIRPHRPSRVTKLHVAGRRPGPSASTASMAAMSNPAWRKISKAAGVDHVGRRSGAAVPLSVRSTRTGVDRARRAGCRAAVNPTGPATDDRGTGPRSPGASRESGRSSDQSGVAAAVQLQVLAGDEAGLGAAQEGAGVAELVGVAESAGRRWWRSSCS